MWNSAVPEPCFQAVLDLFFSPSKVRRGLRGRGQFPGPPDGARDRGGDQRPKKPAGPISGRYELFLCCVNRRNLIIHHS